MSALVVADSQGLFDETRPCYLWTSPNHYIYAGDNPTNNTGPSGNFTLKGFVAKLAVAVLAAPVVAGVCVYTGGIGCAAAVAFTVAATTTVGYAVDTPSDNQSFGGFLRYAANPINQYLP